MLDQNYTIIKYQTTIAELNIYREIFEQVQYLIPRMYEYVSRYSTVRRLQDKDTGKIYHENWNKKGIDTTSEDSYFVVTKREEGRFDIISNDYYNTPRFWWVIAIANNIIDPFELEIGTRLRIPQILSLYNDGGILSENG